MMITELLLCVDLCICSRGGCRQQNIFLYLRQLHMSTKSLYSNQWFKCSKYHQTEMCLCIFFQANNNRKNKVDKIDEGIKSYR